MINMNFLYALTVAVILNLSKAQILYPEDDEPDLEARFGQCITPDKAEGRCILLDDCSSLKQMLTTESLPEQEISYLRASECGRKDNKVMVCCPVKPPPSPTPSGDCKTLPTPGICGRGNTDDRIYGGNATRIDEFPWMVLLEYSKPEKQKGFHCGGVLINDRYVLTASHCVNGKAIPTTWSLTGVRLGEWDLSSSTDCQKGDCSDPVLDIPIERAIPHEQYNPNSRNQINDIALLRLARSVKFTDWVLPICLPSAAHLRNINYVGVNMDVAGWGKTETASVSKIKLKARVDGVSLDQCNSVYGEQRVNLENTQLCAGGVKGIDSCRGDSGGPLIAVNRQNTAVPYYYLVGVVSFGPTPCGLEGWPGVYTNCASYIDWIERNIC